VAEVEEHADHVALWPLRALGSKSAGLDARTDRWSRSRRRTLLTGGTTTTQQSGRVITPAMSVQTTNAGHVGLVG
jgi:hypothetical protein